MRHYSFLSVSLVVFFILSLVHSEKSLALGCEGFTNFPGGEGEGKKYHVLYRDHIRARDYQQAYPLWSKLIKYSPAGHEFHFIDGIEIYQAFYREAETGEERMEYLGKILTLFDHYLMCFGETVRQGRKREGNIHYRKGFTLYYLGVEYDQAYDALQRALELEGNALPSFAFYPLGDITVRKFDALRAKYIEKEDDMPADKLEEFRNVYLNLEAIAEHNMAGGDADEATRYREAWEQVQARFANIEAFIFDCDFMMAKLAPLYESDPDNREQYREIYSTLIRAGCDREHPMLAEIFAKDEAFQAARRDSIRLAQYAENPALHANDLFREGRFNEAAAKYREAIERSTEIDRKAEYAMMLVRIHAYRLNNRSAARAAALEALRYNPNLGEAYLEIGKLYASSGAVCRDVDPFLGWAVSWAAVDKFIQARNVDPSVRAEANDLIARYTAFFPPIEEGFQRNIREGDTYVVGCWINETTTARFNR